MRGIVESTEAQPVAPSVGGTCSTVTRVDTHDCLTPAPAQAQSHISHPSQAEHPHTNACSAQETPSRDCGWQHLWVLGEEQLWWKQVEEVRGVSITERWKQKAREPHSSSRAEKRSGALGVGGAGQDPGCGSFSSNSAQCAPTLRPSWE